MASNNITTRVVPKTSIVLDLKLKVGINQILKNVGDISINYTAPDESQVNQQILRLLPLDTYVSNPSTNTQLMLISTNTPIQINATLKDGTINMVTINKLFVVDSTIKNYVLFNNSNSIALINTFFYTTLIPASSGLTYSGVAQDSGVYDYTFINNLKVTGQGIENSFTANAEADNYIWYAYPTALGTATFSINGFIGGFILVSTTVNVADVFYTLYRSDNSNLGIITVTVF